MFSKGWLGTTTQAELQSQPLFSGVGPVFFCGWSLLGRGKEGEEGGFAHSQGCPLPCMVI